MKKIEELHNNRRDSMQMKILKSFIAKVLIIQGSPTLDPENRSSK